MRGPTPRSRPRRPDNHGGGFTEATVPIPHWQKKRKLWSLKWDHEGSTGYAYGASEAEVREQVDRIKEAPRTMRGRCLCPECGKTYRGEFMADKELRPNLVGGRYLYFCDECKATVYACMFV